MNTDLIKQLKEQETKLFQERSDIASKIRQLQEEDAKESESKNVYTNFDVDGAFKAIEEATNAEESIKKEIKRLRKQQKHLFKERDRYAQLILTKLNEAGICDEEGNELSASDDVYVKGDKIYLESGQSACCMGAIAGVTIKVSRKALEMSVQELKKLEESNKLKGLVDTTVHELDYDGEADWYKDHPNYGDDDED